MALYAIGDLHLSLTADKPMEVFGPAWENYTERIGDALSRAFARLVLLFFALGIFFLAVNELIPYRTLGDRYRVMDTAYWIKNTLRITGIVLLVNGGIQWV